MLTIAVVVPTFQRPDDLIRCLKALERQTRKPEEVLVVARPGDAGTQRLLEGLWNLPITPVAVMEPGQVAALNAGISAAASEIIAITDDDAAPHANWLARIEKHFLTNQRLGGLGGRDWIQPEDNSSVTRVKDIIGKIQWFGRIVGNHHLGVGKPREVDVLKGANMSYRRTAIQSLQFDPNLQGRGAQVNNDLAFSLSVKRRGWRLVYDPAVAVDHYPSVRHDIDQRGEFHPEATYNAAFNLLWATQSELTGWKRWATRQWQEWIGTRGEPGLMRFLRVAAIRDQSAIARFKAARQGRFDARRALRGREKATG